MQIGFASKAQLVVMVRASKPHATEKLDLNRRTANSRPPRPLKHIGGFSEADIGDDAHSIGTRDDLISRTRDITAEPSCAFTWHQNTSTITTLRSRSGPLRPVIAGRKRQRNVKPLR